MRYISGCFALLSAGLLLSCWFSYPLTFFLYSRTSPAALHRRRDASLFTTGSFLHLSSNYSSGQVNSSINNCLVLPKLPWPFSSLFISPWMYALVAQTLGLKCDWAVVRPSLFILHLAGTEVIMGKTAVELYTWLNASDPCWWLHCFAFSKKTLCWCFLPIQK